MYGSKGIRKAKKLSIAIYGRHILIGGYYYDLEHKRIYAKLNQEKGSLNNDSFFF